jgi:DNA mismatch repair protein MutL
MTADERHSADDSDDRAARVSRLDPGTVDRIAAGEVVVRPASVVRELVENSLDAGATRVEVTVDGDGTDLIRVTDDGRGMTEADLRLAVQRHTTSKLSEPTDVERVETLGFRGEALPSIAAVSHLDVVTNAGGTEGVRLVSGDGRPRTEPAGRAVGTTVTVRDLFYNRPARRKSLATARTEFTRVSDVVTRYALTRPGVRFSLSHDGRTVLSTPGSGAFADAVLGVYDRSVAGQSTTFDHETRLDLAGESHPLRVQGLLVYPSVTRASRDHVYVAVNGRALADAALRRAVAAGYGSLLPDGREPVAVVTVSLPPVAVDANVHPAKETVAFLEGDAVESAVTNAVRDALSTADLRRQGDLSMGLEETLSPVDEESVFDDLSVIGQFRGLYLLCEADDELLVVDQHAAHERINYERLRDALDGRVAAATLAAPATVSLSPGDRAVLEEARETLASLGYELEGFGRGPVRVTAVPAPLGRVADPDSLRDALDALGAGETPADGRDELLKDLACHPSLKAGDELTDEQATRLVTRLGACDQPYACPHGRPTVLSIGEETFVRGFERRGTRLDK